ncbi:CHAD domain-containing protein [Cyanobium sp. ATX 6E8]|uniref:CHAD domain-containing protein n=1 Tax=Cyanobium sp. ATX 6E8 TaxID=2823701 RepID=UPI0020CDD039|nr:CHAD domain-containing protein [Cyanobium sp. ATX 6E8]MCP9943322.1 CHAD domain-containing protein [Cyanobium sp. ATX 6E8]
MAFPTRSQPLSNGSFARELLHKHVSKLVQLQAPVSEGKGTEPLHQMRVTMRRLRTTLLQFEPALQLPPAINDQRLAKWVRHLGMARDLDVLRERLEDGFLPQLPQAEVKALRPVIKQLRRERQLAYGHVVEVLQSRSYLEGLAQLQGWLKQPEFSRLGEQPIREWLLEWQGPSLASLFLHPGWQVSSAAGEVEVLHELRRQIKQARYRLENLSELAGGHTVPWIGRFKQGQELLGEFNDLQVLQRAISDQVPGRLEQELPQLEWLLVQHQRHCWEQWRELVIEVLPTRQRRRLWQALSSRSLTCSPWNWVKVGLRRAAARFG